MQGLGPYSTSIKKAEKEIKDMAKKVNDLCGMKFLLGCLLFVVLIIVLLGLLTLCWIGIKESDTGLAAPSQWDLVSDKQMMQEEQPLQVFYFWNKV